ncbi:hypothetical protein YC2023_075679 [Brassica napus]
MAELIDDDDGSRGRRKRVTPELMRYLIKLQSIFRSTTCSTIDRKKMVDLLGQDHPKPVNKPKTILNQHEPIPDSARKVMKNLDK